MIHKTALKTVSCAVLVSFFTSFLSLSAGARNASASAALHQGKALYVAEIIERLGDILDPGKESITTDDLEHMSAEISSLREELFTFIFSPDGTLAIESTDPCASILILASLYTLRGINLVLSLLRSIIKATHVPPQTYAGQIRLAIQLLRKVVDVAMNAPVAGINGLLTFIQYLSCRQSPELN